MQYFNNLIKESCITKNTLESNIPHFELTLLFQYFAGTEYMLQYQEYTSQYLIHLWIVTILSLAPFIKFYYLYKAWVSINIGSTAIYVQY